MSASSQQLIVSIGQVKLRLTSTGNNKDEIISAIDQQVEALLPYAEKYIFGYGADDISTVVGELLRMKHLDLATAESCTGGYLAHLITSASGSSDYFKGSIIADGTLIDGSPSLLPTRIP